MYSEIPGWGGGEALWIRPEVLVAFKGVLSHGEAARGLPVPQKAPPQGFLQTVLV